MNSLPSSAGESSNELKRRRKAAARVTRVTAAVLVAFSLTTLAVAQESRGSRDRLARGYFKNGADTLAAFESISRATRHSIVKIDVDGSTVALAAVIDKTGLAVTKASEIKKGKLTCWLASGKEVNAELIGVDDETDVALVKVNSTALKPIEWSLGTAQIGQWVATPGIAETPQAVGIVSVAPRRILHPRALIGVQIDPRSSVPKIAQVMSGMGAEKAGLKAGDVVVAVNGTAMKENEALSERLREFRGGQTVNLRVKRDTNEFDTAIEMMVPPREPGWRGLDRSDLMDRMGSRPSERSEGFEQVIQHDTVLQDWQCGGPLVDLDGKAIGLNIARAGRVASYALPSHIVKQAIKRLKAKPQDAEKLNTSHDLVPPAQ